MAKAILLSGGIDSIALAYLYRDELSLAITVNYGQKSAQTEITVSKKICQVLQLTHEIINIDCSSLGSGEMAFIEGNISLAPTAEWWPYRNQLLITFASMKVIHYSIDTILIGSVKTDYKHLDGTSKFFKAINTAVSIQEGHVKVEAPAIKLSSVELVIMSKIPDSILLWAHSCHTGNIPCGRCNGCRKYIQVIKELKIE